jgi:signal transduction histidine kinase
MDMPPPDINFSFVLASSVHDMKNSLGLLLNSINEVMVSYPPQNVEHANRYALLEYEAARINSELIQLLSLYRLDHDRINVHIDEHYVMDILNDQIARNAGVLQTRNIALTLACDEVLQGYFDADLVGGIVNNMLLNCARYCKNKLLVAAQMTAEGVCISIEDDGPGYPENMLDAALYSQARIDFSGGRPHLGLWFAQRVALMHKSNTQQGFIRLSNGSTLGGGCFSLYLP